jgi:hypothetical protein
MSSGLNLTRLNEEQKKLEQRGGGGKKNWIPLSKIEEPLDIRILDPLPTMDGVYYVEVPTWWINGQRVISPRLVDKTLKEDIIDEILNEAKIAAKTDKSMAAILNATDPKTSVAKIQFKYDYWVPVLHLKWDVGSDNQIKGILNAKNEYDPELIAKYIADNRVKFLQANITSLKAINTLLTARTNKDMLDAVLGQNLQIQKTGKGRDSKYQVLPTEHMPMPAIYYGPEKFVDPFVVAQSLMYDDDYMAAVIENYLYGDVQVPNKDLHWAYPDIRAELKDRNLDDDAEEDSAPPKSSRANSRVGNRAASAGAAPAGQAPVRRSSGGPAEITPAGDPGTGGTTTTTRTTRTAATGAPKTGGRRRSLVDDLKDAGK